MRRRLSSFCFFLCALGAFSATVLADHPTPYKGRFDFTTVEVRPVSETMLHVRGRLAGNETHLGRFTGEVEYLVDLTTFAFAGRLTKTAANGDTLQETLSGQFTFDDQLNPIGSSGEFTITGGTGRFRDAIGSGKFDGVWTSPDLSTARITFDGSIDFTASGRRG